MAKASPSPDIRIAPTHAQRRFCSTPRPTMKLASRRPPPMIRETTKATVPGVGSGTCTADWNQSWFAKNVNSTSCAAISAARPNWTSAMTMTPIGRRPSGAGAGAFVTGRANLAGGGSRSEDGEGRGKAFGRQPVGLVVVAVDLDRFRRVGDHPDGPGAEPD